MINRSLPLALVLATLIVIAMPVSQASAQSCSGLAALLGICKPAGGGADVRTTTTTCTTLQKLFGCQDSAPAPAPAPSPAPGLHPDGSLDVGTQTGGLTVLPNHDRTADVPAPLWPHPNDRLPWGFSGLGGTGMTSSEGADVAAAAGATIQRATISWPGVEYRKGKYGWGATDALYRALVARGIRPLFTIFKTPGEYVDPGLRTPRNCGGTIFGVGRSCTIPPSALQMWRLKEFARRMAVRYPLLAGIEIWNEPNLARYWTTYPDPATYATMLRWADQGVNTPAAPDGSGGRPEIRVIGGALLGRSFTNSEGYSDSSFLAKMLENRAGPAMDGLSIHPYPYAPDRSRAWLPTFSRIASVLTAQLDSHVRGIRLLATEVGLTTGTATPSSISVDPALQATALRAYYDELDQPAPDLPGAERVDTVTFHTLADHDLDGSNGGFGMVAPHDALNRRPVKHSFCAFRTQVSNVSGPLPDSLSVPPELLDSCNLPPGTTTATQPAAARSSDPLASTKRAARLIRLFP